MSASGTTHLHIAPTAFLLLDGELKIRSASFGAIGLLGQRPAGLVGREIAEVLDHPALTSAAREVLDQQSTQTSFYLDHEGPLGTVPLQIDLALMLDLEGQLRLALSITDRSSEQQTAEQLVAVRDRMSRLLSRLPGLAMGCRLDERWRIDLVGGGVDSLGPWTLAVLRSRELGLLDLVHPDDAAQLVLDVAAAPRPTAPFRWRVRTHPEAGTVAWIEIAGHLMPSRRGGERLEAFVTDVTATRDLEEQLRHAQKMEAVGRLAGGIAHDFNNMLSIILTRADLMLMREVGDHAVVHGLEQVRAAAERAAVMTRQLQGMARPQPTGDIRAPLEQIVERTADFLAPLFTGSYSLEVVLAPQPSWVRAEPGRLEQLLVNLALNAKEAMPRGGQLRVETSHTHSPPQGLLKPTGTSTLGYALITVRDTGTGMSPEVARQAFEPFFTTHQGRGSGLGLSIVYSVARECQGDLVVETSMGSGTAITLVVPCISQPAEEATRPPTRSRRGLRARILVVDDTTGVREMSAEVLELAGHEVRQAEDGAQALELADSHRFDLVLTDVVMPGMSGRELALRLRTSQPGLPVVFMSGHTEDVVLAQGVAQGIEHFLAKPFRPQALIDLVEQVLAR